MIMMAKVSYGQAFCQMSVLSLISGLFSRKRFDIENVFTLNVLMIVARATSELRCLPISLVSFGTTNHYHEIYIVYI